jgi:hypothetical protein
MHVVSATVDNGYVSSFLPDDTELKSIAELAHSPALVAHADNKLYIHNFPYTSIPNNIQVVDLSAGLLTNSNKYSEYLGRQERMAMVFNNGKLLIGDVDENAQRSFIRLVDANTLAETDSIHMDTYQPIHDMYITNERLLVNHHEKITVIDLKTWEEIKTIDLPYTSVGPPSSFNWSQFVPGNDNDVFIYDGGIRKLRTDDLTLKILKRQEESATVKPAFNASANLLYIITLADNSDLNTHMVRKFNPTSEQEEDLIDHETISMDVKFISYHARNNLIIVGGRKLGLPNGVIKTFTTDGKLVKTYSLEGQALSLF